MFAVKLANFLMFSVSEENSVKCLEDPSDIFGNGRTSSLVFGNLQQYSGIAGSLRKSCDIIRNCRKMAENSLIYYRKIHYLTREFHVKLHAKTDIARIAKR